MKQDYDSGNSGSGVAWGCLFIVIALICAVVAVVGGMS